VNPAFFSTLTDGAFIAQIRLRNISIRPLEPHGANRKYYIGGIAGKATISLDGSLAMGALSVTGNITLPDDGVRRFDAAIGGIVGSLKQVYLQGVYSKMNIRDESLANTSIGGLVGEMFDSDIYSSFFYGNISSKALIRAYRPKAFQKTI